jgi:hypothetical protein
MNIFDITKDNVNMIKIDSFEAAVPVSAQVRCNIIKASEKQLSYLKSLFEQRTGSEEAMIIREHLLGEFRKGTLSLEMASQAITDVKAIPRDALPLNLSNAVHTFGQAAPTHDFDHGQVWMDTAGRFVKVCLNQAGTNFYGKVWNMDTQQWDYNGGALRAVDHQVTAEEAKRWSEQWAAEHRNCVFCSKHLSDPRSEYAGYGETCAENHNLPWGALPEKNSEEWDAEHNMQAVSTLPADVYEYPYGDGTCRICRQPRPFFVNGLLRGCNC